VFPVRPLSLLLSLLLSYFPSSDHSYPEKINAYTQGKNKEKALSILRARIYDADRARKQVHLYFVAVNIITHSSIMILNDLPSWSCLFLINPIFERCCILSFLAAKTLPTAFTLFVQVCIHYITWYENTTPSETFLKHDWNTSNSLLKHVKWEKNRLTCSFQITR
jgi:hypothetical protein